MKKVLKWIILIVIFMLIIPFLVCLFLIPRELYIRENLLTFIGLIISYYSLCSSIGIAILIYYIQKRDGEYEEKEKIEKAKATLLLEIENSFENLFSTPVEEINYQENKEIVDIFDKYTVELKNTLSSKEFILLAKIVNSICKCDKEEIAKFLRVWIQPIYLSDYQSCLVRVNDFNDLLNKKVYQLINNLGNKDENYEELDCIYDVKNQKVCEKVNKKVKIYDKGLCVVDAILGDYDIFDRYVVIEGFAKNDEYKGYYKDRKYNGKGILYDGNGDVLEQGEWVDGELKNGVMYNCIIHIIKGQLIYKENSPDDPYDSTEDFDYDIFSQYGQLDLVSSMIYELEMDIAQNGIESYYVFDFEVNNNKIQKITNIRTLADFLEKKNKELLAEINDVINDKNVMDDIKISDDY